MDEIRKNNLLQIKTTDCAIINGIVANYSHDRILVLISEDCIEQAKTINELDELDIAVATPFGLKHMKSSVISKPDKNNSIVIENNPAMPVEQKREFARVVANIKFKISYSGKIFDADCINISAGGVAFFVKGVKFEKGAKVSIHLFACDFEKDIITSADIIKSTDSYCVAKFLELKQTDEDKIMKFVFKLMTMN